MSKATRISDRNLLPLPVRRRLDQLEMSVYANPKFKSWGKQMTLLETYRTLERSCFLWGKGRTVKDFQRIGLDSYSHFAAPEEHKVSWLNHPNQSMHYRKCAFDAVISDYGWRKIVNPIWSRIVGGFNYYNQLGREAVHHGFRSFEASYGQDSFHFELPIVPQTTATSCYCFAIYNALQKIRPELRYLDKQTIKDWAIELFNASKAAKKSHPTKIFEFARHTVHINGFEEIPKENLKSFEWWKSQQNKAIVIYQKRKSKTNYWQELRDGNGVYGHAYVFDTTDNKNKTLWCRNSHAEAPIFELKNLDVISKAYQIW